MATLSWILDVNAPNAQKTFSEIGLRIDELDRTLRKTREITLGDKGAMAKIAGLQIQADRFGDRIHNMPLTIEGAAKAEAQLLALEATADRLNEKLGSGRVGGRTAGGFFKGLVSSSALSAFLSGGGSGGSGGGAAAAAGTGGIGDFLSSPAGIGGIAAGAPFASALVDALAGFGLGSGVAGAGALGAFKAQPGAFAPGLGMIKTSLDNVFKSIAPTLGMMTASLGRFVQSEQGPLAKLFSASLPFAQAWIKIMTTAAKQILPSLTQVLQQMVSSGALKLMVQGFASLTRGVADFIRYLGPGFRAGAEIFRATAIAMGGIIAGLGATLGTLGNTAGHVMTWIHDRWDWLRAHTANVFDGMRHDIAHDWDMIFNNTVARAERGLHDIAHEFDVWRHNVAAIFDTFKHDVATVWDLIWNNTEGREMRGIRDVVGWFGKLPGQVIHAVNGLGTDLYNFAHMAMTKLWNGLKSVFGDVWNWFGSLPSKLLHAIGIHSPPDWAIEAGKHIMGGLLHGITSRKSELMGAFASTVGVGAAAGGVAGGNAALGRRMAAAWGWSNQWAYINDVAMRESGWSMIAQNPSSPAYGIAQFIKGPSEYYQWGGNPNTAIGQITGFYNYIRGTYGSPARAWAHELAYGWYGSGLSGAIFNRPTLIGVGERGPERVDVTPLGHAHGGGGITIQNLHITLPYGTDREQGRRIVEAIRRFEQGSGDGWRR